jgi:hypothetical protein
MHVLRRHRRQSAGVPQQITRLIIQRPVSRPLGGPQCIARTFMCCVVEDKLKSPALSGRPHPRRSWHSSRQLWRPCGQTLATRRTRLWWHAGSSVSPPAAERSPAGLARGPTLSSDVMLLALALLTPPFVVSTVICDRGAHWSCARSVLLLQGSRVGNCGATGLGVAS